MDVLEILNLIKDKLPGIDIKQLAADIDSKRSGYSVLAVELHGGKFSELTDFLQASAGEGDYIVDMGSDVAAYLLKNKSRDEYRSPAEFAQNLQSSIRQETGLNVKIGIGEFKGQMSAFEGSMSALRLGALTGNKKSVFSFKEYLMLCCLQSLPREEVERYYEIMLDKNVLALLSDREMTDTADEFLNCSLNISEASRKLYLHRNTLLYRLDKIEEVTGLDIRSFEGAMVFRFMMILYRLNNAK